MLDQKKAESANYEALIQEAKNQAAVYAETIKQQNAAIKKIQEEEASRITSYNVCYTKLLRMRN